MAKTVKICHLYPDLMDTYGDKGNIIALKNRAEWRNIGVSCEPITIGQKLTDDFDIYFFGGGQDRQQGIVGKDLKTKASAIKSAISQGSVLLSVCGGYQLLQKYFKTKEGETIEGIGLFDAYTVGSDNRMIQNLLIEINPRLHEEINQIYKTKNQEPITNNQLVGFENHSGKTYLEGETKPLGTVIVGAGNNGEDKTEGAVYKNAFGCYLHGSLLPKNPHFADLLLSKALNTELEPLDDTIEWHAHDQAIKRARTNS